MKEVENKYFMFSFIIESQATGEEKIWNAEKKNTN